MENCISAENSLETNMAVIHLEFYNESGKNQGAIAVNQDIYNYIQNNNSEDFTDILKSDNRMQVFYHLSPIRMSILNWYDFAENSSVLEIGGEFGALTGLLCDTCAHVTTVEYGRYKAQAIAERYKKRNNLDIYAGNVLDIKFKETFNYVIMVGSLERQCSGDINGAAYTNYLKQISGLLKPDGTLLLAVDNQYGLKYLCGETDDYTELPFGSINGRVQKKKGRLFHKKELHNIIRDSGWENIKYYYPMPDYKLPQMIYTDDYLPKKDVKERLILYYKNMTSLVMNEKDLYADIIENGVFPFFSNSYLVEAWNKGNCSNAIYATVTTDRGCIHGTATSIHQQEDKCWVKKKSIFEEGFESIQLIYNNLSEMQKRNLKIVPHEWERNELVMPYIKQPACSEFLRILASEQRKDEFVWIFDLLYDDILKSSDHVDAKENKLLDYKDCELDFGPILKNVYVDMVPFNCFFIDGHLWYFDQEFKRDCFPAKYPLYRALMYTYAFTTEAEAMIPLKDMIERYELEQIWDIFKRVEENFVSENRQYDVYQHFYKWTQIDINQILGNAEKIK